MFGFTFVDVSKPQAVAEQDPSVQQGHLVSLAPVYIRKSEQSRQLWDQAEVAREEWGALKRDFRAGGHRAGQPSEEDAERAEAEARKKVSVAWRRLCDAQEAWFESSREIFRLFDRLDAAVGTAAWDDIANGRPPRVPSKSHPHWLLAFARYLIEQMTAPFPSIALLKLEYAEYKEQVKAAQDKAAQDKAEQNKGT